MSLLHQALKKAEKEKGKVLEGEAFVDKEEERKPIGVRTLLLLGLVVLGFLYLGYLQFFGRKGSEVIQQPERSLSAVNGVDLKKEADYFLQMGEWAKARSGLERLVLQEPQNPEIYNNLGLTFKKLGNKPKAYEQYQKALALRPDFPEVQNNLGVLYLSDLRLEEARSYFEQALALRPDYPEPHFHLGLIAEARGQGPIAKEHFQKFLQSTSPLDPRFKSEIESRINSLVVNE